MRTKNLVHFLTFINCLLFSRVNSKSYTILSGKILLPRSLRNVAEFSREFAPIFEKDDSNRHFEINPYSDKNIRSTPRKINVFLRQHNSVDKFDIDQRRTINSEAGRLGHHHFLQHGCEFFDGFHFEGEVWYSRGCRRHTCLHFEGKYFVETDSCDSEIYNTTYKCIIEVDLRKDYPHCCPRYKCNPDNLGNRVNVIGAK